MKSTYSLSGKVFERPDLGYNLTLRLVDGQNILKTNSGNIASLKLGDVLEMKIFNRHVKRAFALKTKTEVMVTVKKSKSGMIGIETNNRFMPFSALRGYVNFTVMSLTEHNPSPKIGSYETI